MRTVKAGNWFYRFGEYNGKLIDCLKTLKARGEILLSHPK